MYCIIYIFAQNYDCVLSITKVVNSCKTMANKFLKLGNYHHDNH